MSQGTPQRSGPEPDERAGGAVRDRSHDAPRHAPHPRPPVHPPVTPRTTPPPMTPPPGMPRQAPPGYGYRAYPPPTGGWAPIGAEDYDTEDPRAPGNPAASFSAVLGVLALLVGLRPLAFGSMALSWDGFVGIAIALAALVAGAVGLRTSVRRPVAVVGMVLAVVALLVVAVLPTL